MGQKLVEYITGKAKGNEAEIPEDEGVPTWFVFARPGVQIQIMDGLDGEQWSNGEEFCVEVLDPLTIFNLRYVCGAMPLAAGRRFIPSNEILEIDGPIAESDLAMIRPQPTDSLETRCSLFERAFTQQIEKKEREGVSDGEGTSEIQVSKRDVHAGERDDVQQRGRKGSGRGRKNSVRPASGEHGGEGQ